MKTKKLITETLIDQKYVMRLLIDLFPYSILIDSSLNVLSVSRDIKNLLLFNRSEPTNWNFIDQIKSPRKGFEDRISELQTVGYFEPSIFELKNKFGTGIKVKIAGFYLGIILDSSDIIVLMIQDLDKLSRYQNIFDNKVLEYDELVYRTSHDLKGPIATMKGLLNLTVYENDATQIKNIINLLNHHLNILDLKTSVISSFNKVFKSDENKFENVNIDVLNSITKKIIKEKKCRIQYSTSTKYSNSFNYNRNIISDIIKLLIDAIGGLVSENKIAQLQLEILHLESEVQLIYSTTNIEFNLEQVRIMQSPKYLIKEAINNNIYQCFYSLMNYINKYHGFVQFNYKTEDQFQFLIYLPKNRELL